MLPSKVCDKIHGWSLSMQDGDKIIRHGNTITIYNECGCELDSITF